MLFQARLNFNFPLAIDAPILKITFAQDDESAGINTRSRSEQAESESDLEMPSLSLESDEEIKGAIFSNRIDVYENKHYNFNCKSTSIPRTSRVR